MADLMQASAEQGHTVAAIVHSHDNALPEREEYKGCDVLRVPCYGQLTYAPIAPSFLFRLRSFAQTFRPDVIHIHMPNVSGFWCLLLNEIKQVPWVVHWHSDVLGAAPDWKVKTLYPLYKPFESALLKRAKAIIATSPNYLESSEPLKAFKHKTCVIPLSLHPARLPNIKPAAESRTGPLRLLCIGRLTYYKGHEYLLRAVARLDVPVQLGIVGKGELSESLGAICRSLGIESRVTFHGHVDEITLLELLSHCDLLCQPSIERTEAFGLALLEAAYLSKPALVTRVEGSGMTWVVQQEKTGLVAIPESVESLVEQLDFAAGHRDVLEEMGVAARQRFEQEFAMEQITGKLLRLYGEVSLCD